MCSVSFGSHECDNPRGSLSLTVLTKLLPSWKSGGVHLGWGGLSWIKNREGRENQICKYSLCLQTQRHQCTVFPHSETPPSISVEPYVSCLTTGMRSSLCPVSGSGGRNGVPAQHSALTPHSLSLLLTFTQKYKAERTFRSLTKFVSFLRIVTYSVFNGLSGGQWRSSFGKDLFGNQSRTWKPWDKL